MLQEQTGSGNTGGDIDLQMCAPLRRFAIGQRPDRVQRAGIVDQTQHVPGVLRQLGEGPLQYGRAGVLCREIAGYVHIALARP